MKVLTAVIRARWCAAPLALVLTGALAGSASAAVRITIDPTAKLSPGRLHATLTGSVACDYYPGGAALSGQIVQPGAASGYGSISAPCDGTPHLYTIDVSTGMGMASGVFVPGPASAQVSQANCGPMGCDTTYTDAIINLVV
jgi:hypothetical protein